MRAGDKPPKPSVADLATTTAPPPPAPRPLRPSAAGAVAALPSERIDDIVSSIRPQLRSLDYDGALERAVVGIGLGLADGNKGRPGGLGGIVFQGVLTVWL